MTVVQATLTAVVCTRNRPKLLGMTLDALQAVSNLPVLVIDQSDVPDPGLTERSATGLLRVVHDHGRGLSRARNRAAAELESDWMVFVDDDCTVEESFADDLRAVLRAHPGIAYVGPRIDVPKDRVLSELLVTAFAIEQEVVLQGRWTPPWTIGFGPCAVRRDWALRVGGWDERFGAGTMPFPAAEDMDFNYRLLKAGGVAVATPAVRVVHDQWREPPALVELFEGYATASAGLACKHLKTGDVAGGLWLWGLEAYAALRMMASAAKRRSRLRARVGAARLRGHLRGTMLGLRTRW